MKFTKRGASVGVMVRWMHRNVLRFGIITRVPAGLSVQYQIRECSEDSRIWYIENTNFTIHKA
jgi:hypothetical protein